VNAGADQALPALEVVGLNAFYGKSQVVFDLEVSVRRSETVALLGRNGAGKTSTLMAVAGIVSARAEGLRLGGSDISMMPPFKRVRAGLFLVPSGSRVFPNLTVAENLGMVKPAKNQRPGWTIEEVYSAFPKLRELRDSRGGQLSGGERQMLSIARALLSHPDVLMLDEPSEGLAPLVVRGIGEMLKQLNREGIAVLLTEQNHRLALDIADRAYFIEKGQVVWEGGADEATDPEVIGRYLAVER
jgi:branched-chain amino acid transport system ATP-binding protein